MVNFLITGPYRSGTTYLSAILNSQENSVCIEYNYLIFQDHKSEKDKIFFLNQIGADYLHFPMDFPDFSKAKNKKESMNIFTHSALQYFNVQHFGFKKTMLNNNQIHSALEEGFKVIILKRNSHAIYDSWIRRINKNDLQAFYDLYDYLKQINFYDFPNKIKDKILIIDYESLLNNKIETLKTISDYLGFEITTPKTLYYSWNKNKKEYINNSSNVYETNRNRDFLDDRQFLKLNRNLKFHLYHNYRRLNYLLGKFKSYFKT